MASTPVGETASPNPAMGPLRVSRDNPRYFADPEGKAVLLVGGHTWNSLVDIGKSDPPEPFSFPGYLEYLARHHHNFIRLWAWDSTSWDTRANGRWGKDFVHHAAPHPWLRTGPGDALDGRPRFDLSQFNPAYFRRLRNRVEEAGQRGIYVSIMLFEGWGMMHGNLREPAEAGWAWCGHPFNPANNVNRTMADVPTNSLTGPVHSLRDPVTNELQATYIRRVVDTVNDLDNVLYEVINEGGEREWDWWVVKVVREYERGLPKQHPIGITGHGAEDVASMQASPADWISPGSRDGYRDDPPAWDGGKVSLLDTDHVWGIGGNLAWVWKAFLQGHNPLFMDTYDGTVLGTRFDPQFEPVRRGLGDVRHFAERLDLRHAEPRGDWASTGYCLAAPGSWYLVLVPGGGEVSVDLSGAPGTLRGEWFDAEAGGDLGSFPVTGGAKQTFTTPTSGPDWVLVLDDAASGFPPPGTPWGSQTAIMGSPNDTCQ